MRPRQPSESTERGSTVDQDNMHEAALEVAERMTAIIDEIAISATVQASATISEGITLALDNCKGEGRPLTFCQQMDVQQAFMFTFREYEDLLRKQISAILAIHTAAAGFTPEDIIGDREEAE